MLNTGYILQSAVYIRIVRLRGAEAVLRTVLVDETFLWEQVRGVHVYVGLTTRHHLDYNIIVFPDDLGGRNLKNASQKAKCFLKVSPNMPNPNPHIFTAMNTSDADSRTDLLLRFKIVFCLNQQ